MVLASIVARCVATPARRVLAAIAVRCFRLRCPALITGQTVNALFAMIFATISILMGAAARARRVVFLAITLIILIARVPFAEPARSITGMALALAMTAVLLAAMISILMVFAPFATRLVCMSRERQAISMRVLPLSTL